MGEEGTDKEEGTESEDTNGIEGATKEFTVCLARAVKHERGGEMLLPLQQPRTLYLQLPIGEGIQNRPMFKPKGGDGTKEGREPGTLKER